MRISDWSADVCSSDLTVAADGLPDGAAVQVLIRPEALHLTPLEDGCPLPPHSVAVMASRLMGRTSLVHLRSLELPEGAPHFHARVPGRFLPPERSEEHTSELQSLMRNSYAVICLKKHRHKTTTYIH